MKRRLADCLDEVAQGVGADWHKYRVLGATRDGVAPAKEPVGKSPARYKHVVPGTIFYNPMRIMIGSIAMLDDGDEPGITSPDYVVLRAREGILHPRWFYYWLRSRSGEELIATLARGAVRERMMFKRLATGEIELPAWEHQLRVAEQLTEVAKARTAVQAQLAAAQALPAASLRAVFNSPNVQSWLRRCLGDVCELLPSKSICLTGDAEVRAITTASLTETGFDPAGIKTGRMWSSDVPECTVRAGEILIARSNTPELVGRVALFNGESPGAVASDLTIRIWPGDEVHGDFLTRYLSFLYLSGYWRERAGGSSGTMKKITRSQILAEKVPVPPFDEQECVAARLAAELAEVTRLRESLSGKLETLDRLPAALLAQAFQGDSSHEG